MIRGGDTIENPVTGERIVFHETSRETDGEAVVFETFVQPDGFVAATHLHPKQEERFEVVSGTLRLRIGDEEIVAGPGETLTIPAGTRHCLWGQSGLEWTGGDQRGLERTNSRWPLTNSVV